jgi:hypothetical protein
LTHAGTQNASQVVLKEGRVSRAMRKHLRGEKPFEQPSESVLAYQYDVNKIKESWPVVR